MRGKLSRYRATFSQAKLFNLKKPKRLAACVSVIVLKATRSWNTAYSQYYISKPLKVKKEKHKTKQNNCIIAFLIGLSFIKIFPAEITATEQVVVIFCPPLIFTVLGGIVSRITPWMKCDKVLEVMSVYVGNSRS